MEGHILERTKERRGKKRITVYACKDCQVSYIKPELPLRDKNGNIINLVNWERRELEFPVLETPDRYIELKNKLEISIIYKDFPEDNACEKCNAQMNTVWLIYNKENYIGKYCPECKSYYFEKYVYQWHNEIFCLSHEEQVIWERRVQLERELSKYIHQNYDAPDKEFFAWAYIDDEDFDKVNIEVYIDENYIDAGVAQKLNQYMHEKDITTAMIYERCYVDRRTISKFMNCSNYHPSKNTMLALCIGLQLNLQESEEFLLLAGYSLSNASKYDLIFKFVLKNEIYDIDFINDRLSAYGYRCLGE